MPRIVKRKPLKNSRLSQSLYEIYDRRRKYPRVIVEIPATVKISDEVEMEVQIYDLSSDGIQIRCERGVASIICPGGKIKKKYMKRDFKLIFNLNYRNGEKTVCINVIPIYLLFISKNMVAFGMQFHQHDKDMLKIISDYIDFEVAPNIEELEEILLEKIGKMKTADIQVPEEIGKKKIRRKNVKAELDDQGQKYDLAKINKNIQEVRRYRDILEKVLNKLSMEIEDIETQFNLKNR